MGKHHYCKGFGCFLSLCAHVAISAASESALKMYLSSWQEHVVATYTSFRYLAREQQQLKITFKKRTRWQPWLLRGRCVTPPSARHATLAATGRGGIARERFHIKFVKRLKGSDHFWKMSTKCARDLARAGFHVKTGKKLTTSDHFFKMRSTKCARDCSKSSISYVNHIVIK